MMRAYLFLLAFLLISTKPAFSEDEAYVFFMRTGVQEDKMRFIGEHMNLNIAEEQAFWPIYREYLKELYQTFDKKFMLIKEFGENFEIMTDDKASAMFTRTLIIQEEINRIKKRYYPHFERALGSGARTLRFYQIDRRLDLITDLKMIEELPLINTARGLDQERIRRHQESLPAVR